jgi:HlyD family secretion protein
VASWTRALLGLALAGAGAVTAWEVKTVIGARRGDDESMAAVRPVRAHDGTRDAVTALGRLEPRDGVIRVAGPSKSSVVVAKLLVDEGDHVTAGQTIAVLDTFAALEATVDRLRCELVHTEREHARHEKLSRERIVSPSEREQWRTQEDVARARLDEAKAELVLAQVQAPIDGEVLEIYARAGEKVGADGIAEIGRTGEMYAVAEVYETDIERVRLGQRATVTSAALRAPLQGTVAKIHRKIGKQDVLDTDPAARTDARVVEVEIRLDESAPAAGLTNLQVDVAIVADAAGVATVATPP